MLSLPDHAPSAMFELAVEQLKHLMLHAEQNRQVEAKVSLDG